MDIHGGSVDRKRQTTVGLSKTSIFRAFRCYVFGTLGNDEANIVIRYYLVPCRLSTDPKIHDLE